MAYDNLAYLTQGLANTPDGSGVVQNVTVETTQVNLKTKQV